MVELSKGKEIRILKQRVRIMLLALHLSEELQYGFAVSDRLWHA